jgi:hypothetical protein
MSEGAWVFLSHPHKDFDKVSLVRNFLEAQRHHPLMFFLKCLDDGSEIEDLIRREIQSRSWFVLCDSANAQASLWVQQEVEIIKNLPTRTYSRVNLDDPAFDPASDLFSLTRKASVFLSYAQGDREVANRVRVELKHHDFGVFSDLELAAGENWRVRIEAELEKAALQGAVIIFVSSWSVRSPFITDQIRQAITISRLHSQRTHIIPVYLDASSVLALADPVVRESVVATQGIDFSQGSFEQNMLRLMTALRQFEWRP